MLLDCSVLFGFGKKMSFNHHHHIVLVARISLTLSRHSSLSFIALGRSSGQHPVSSHSCWMYVRAGRPAFARPCVGIHKSTSLMSSSLLLQQCPAWALKMMNIHDNALNFWREQWFFFFFLQYKNYWNYFSKFLETKVRGAYYTQELNINTHQPHVLPYSEQHDQKLYLCSKPGVPNTLIMIDQ